MCRYPWGVCVRYDDRQLSHCGAVSCGLCGSAVKDDVEEVRAVMPIYEYRCHQCGEKFDKLVRCDADETSLSCPNCGSKQAEKLLSVFGTSGFSTTPNFTSPSSASCEPLGQSSG